MIRERKGGGGQCFDACPKLFRLGAVFFNRRLRLLPELLTGGDGFGFESMVRIISMDYNDLSNKTPLNVEVI